MKELNIYCFLGQRETYKQEDRHVAGLAIKIEDDWHLSSHAAESKPDINFTLFASALPHLISKIKTRFEELNHIRLITSVTNKDPDTQYLIERLFNTDNDYGRVAEGISEDRKMSEAKKLGLMSIATSLKSLTDHFKGLTICSNLIENKKGEMVDLKITETDKVFIEGIIHADAAASRAYFNSLKGDNCSIQEVITPKDLKGKTKDIPNLIGDNIIFNWLTDTQVDLGNVSGNIYYTGNGELENKKPKGIKIDKVASKGFVYFTGNNKRLRVLGRLSAEDRYNVVILKERAEYLEKVFAYQREVNKKLYTTEQIVAYRRPVVFGPGVSNYIEEDDFSVVGSSIQGDLYTLTPPRKDISYVFNPPRLGFKIKRELGENQTRLVAHLNGQTESMGMRATDITDVIYETDSKGKCKVKSSFNNQVKSFKLEGITIPKDDKPRKVKVLVKYDLPERNFLSKLIKDNPKVEMLTWMIDDHTVAYGFVITTDKGWLFYHAQYGSRFLLRTASAKARAK